MNARTETWTTVTGYTGEGEKDSDTSDPPLPLEPGFKSALISHSAPFLRNIYTPNSFNFWCASNTQFQTKMKNISFKLSRLLPKATEMFSVSVLTTGDDMGGGFATF